MRGRETLPHRLSLKQPFQHKGRVIKRNEMPNPNSRQEMGLSSFPYRERPFWGMIETDFKWGVGISRARNRAQVAAIRMMEGSTNHREEGRMRRPGYGSWPLRGRLLFFLVTFLWVFLIGCSQVKILRPEAGSTFPSGQRIEFEGEITPSFETGYVDLADELFWSSSIDGQLGSGRRVATDRLSVGSHGITASWPYHTRSDSISIRINP